MTIIEQELTPGCTVAAQVFTRAMARIAAWEPRPCALSALDAPAATP